MSTKSLWVIATLVARAGKSDELRELLEGLVEPTHAEVGCIRYELLQNNVNDHEFTFVEEWTTQAALDAHLQTPHLMHAKERFEVLLGQDLDLRLCTKLK